MNPSTQSYYSPIDFVDSIQDAYDEIAAFSGCILKAESLNLIGNRTYYDMRTEFADYMCVTGLWNPQIKQWLVPTSLRELDSFRNDWETCIGQPKFFCPVNYRYVAIYPKLNTTGGELYMFYKAAADTLSGNTVPQIPLEIQEQILREYVLHDLHEQQMEFTKAQLRWKKYQKKLTELVALKALRDLERLPRLGGN